MEGEGFRPCFAWCNSLASNVKTHPQKKVPKLGYRFQRTESPKILKIQPTKNQQRLFGVFKQTFGEKDRGSTRSGERFQKKNDLSGVKPKILNPTNIGLPSWPSKIPPLKLPPRWITNFSSKKSAWKVSSPKALLKSLVLRIDPIRTSLCSCRRRVFGGNIFRWGRFLLKKRGGGERMWMCVSAENHFVFFLLSSSPPKNICVPCFLLVPVAVFFIFFCL